MNRSRRTAGLRVVGMLTICGLHAFVPAASIAQTSDAVVSITSEPDHRIRFDNGRVRMYEVVLPKGKATLWHEHRADSFSVTFGAAEITNEPRDGKPVVVPRAAGTVGFNSTADGPYSHRVVVTGETTFHVLVTELLTSSPGSSGNVARRAGPFTLALENPRGRAYRLTLGPGEMTEAFTRPANSALFAISSGRVSEHREGQPPRLWDFEPAHFRWFDASDKLAIKNEGAAPIDLVEIEIW